jgi:hypothetical protein
MTPALFCVTVRAALFTVAIAVPEELALTTSTPTLLVHSNTCDEPNGLIPEYDDGGVTVNRNNSVTVADEPNGIVIVTVGFTGAVPPFTKFVAAVVPNV